MSPDLPHLRSGVALVPERTPDRTDHFCQILSEPRPQAKALWGRTSARVSATMFAKKVGSHNETPEPTAARTDAFAAIAGRMQWLEAS
ncbi:MAG TPA: hypothetical protein PKY30_14050 [Myxococcota bacterium]|nr:hypothetical protein [Myxococcota bacterium]HNH48160.1 hypothetical protein [Myxococcota bacterium]